MYPALLSAVTEHLLVVVHLAVPFTQVFMVGKSERKVIRTRFLKDQKRALSTYVQT